MKKGMALSLKRRNAAGGAARRRKIEISGVAVTWRHQQRLKYGAVAAAKIMAKIKWHQHRKKSSGISIENQHGSGNKREKIKKSVINK